MYELDGKQLKVFAQALTSISRIGSFVFISTAPNDLKISTVNASKSAFALFTFNNSFFLKSGAIPESVIKLHVKPIVHLFRQNNNLELLNTCSVSVNNDRFVIKLNCKHGITKTHSFTYQDSEIVNAIYSNDTPNRFVSPPKALNSVLQTFHNCMHVTLKTSPYSFSISNSFQNSNDGFSFFN